MNQVLVRQSCRWESTTELVSLDVALPDTSASVIVVVMPTMPAYQVMHAVTGPVPECILK